MRNEYQANEQMSALAAERARWATVLGKPGKAKPAPRRTLFALIFGF